MSDEESEEYSEDTALQLAIQMSLQETAKEEIPDETYEVNMFLTENISSLISESCIVYQYEELFNDIMDFTFDLLKVYVINYQRSSTLAISSTITPRDIFKFLKTTHGMSNHNARMFFPSRWFQMPKKICARVNHAEKNFQNVPVFTFSENHDMNTLVEATRHTNLWDHKLSHISFCQNDHVDITFEKHIGSNDFPIRESTGLNVGTVVVGKDRYNKWYHAQIVCKVDGAELIRQRSLSLADPRSIYRHDALNSIDIDVDATYFYIHFLGFKSTWNEWMDSEKVYKEKRVLTVEEARTTGLKMGDWKWSQKKEEKNA